MTKNNIFRRFFDVDSQSVSPTADDRMWAKELTNFHTIGTSQTAADGMEADIKEISITAIIHGDAMDQSQNALNFNIMQLVLCRSDATFTTQHAFDAVLIDKTLDQAFDGAYAIEYIGKPFIYGPNDFISGQNDANYEEDSSFIVKRKFTLPKKYLNWLMRDLNNEDQDADTNTLRLVLVGRHDKRTDLRIQVFAYMEFRLVPKSISLR